MFTFNDFLEKANIDPKEVLLMRHTPESELRHNFPFLAAERPELYNAYQSFQPNKKVEAALYKAVYLASFIGVDAKQAHFVGIYKNNGSTPKSAAEYWAMPNNRELCEYGMSKDIVPDRFLHFQLESVTEFELWLGRLIIEWNNERAWSRRADQNSFRISAMLETSAFKKPMPTWDILTLTWSELKALPSEWSVLLGGWRGIYLILDETDGKTYVGSAYGKDNLLGRWREYARTGHGGNRDLRGRNPAKFRFSILQRVSPDMDEEEVIRLENTWKKRLHTREFGLNRN